MSSTTSNREKSPGTISPIDVPLQQLPIVELSTQHIKRASELAKDRNHSYNKIDGGTVFGNQDALTSHQTGILGEIAVSKMYGASIDTEAHDFGDDGFDVSLWGEETDVKSTTTDAMRYPELLVPANSELTADLYMLTHILNWGPDGARIRILGYATRQQVENRTPYRHPGTTENHVVKPRDLTLPPLTQACNE